MLLAYGTLFSDKFYPGVSVANTDLSGQTQGNVRGVLEARVKEFDSSPLLLRHADNRWPTTPVEIGLSVDLDQTIEHGYKMGREGGMLDRAWQSLVALVRGHPMTVAFSLDRSALGRVLAKAAAEIDQPAVDAKLVVDETGAIRSVPARAGLRLDVDATAAQIEQSFQVFSTNEVKLVVSEVSPGVTEANLAETRTTAQAMASQPLVIKNGDKSWSLNPGDVAKMLVFKSSQGSPRKTGAELDQAKLKDFLVPIAQEIDVKPKEASINYTGGQFSVSPSAEGKVVDMDGTIGSINRELALGNHVMAPVLKSALPSVTEDDLAKVKTKAQTIIGQPFKVTYRDNAWTLSPERLARMLKFSKVETGAQTQIEAGLDRKTLAEFVDGLAPSVGSKPRDARFSYYGGKLSVLSKDVDGVTIDVEKTVESIESLAATDFRQAEVIVKAEKARVQAADAANIRVNDLLASASTSYAGGIAARSHNVELATARLNGVVVPPGETLSVNAALGPTTLAAGFRIGYGITLSGTTAVTVESVGGGICQVATTLYHSAFWAGLEIEERQPHLYWISRYGQPPKGMTGLDATVDDPGTDLRIKNNTGNWIAIQSNTSGGNVNFSIYGVDPGWKVTAEGPILRNWVEADTTIVEEEDPSMPEGSSLLVEHAEAGFDSTVIRHVEKDGKEIDRYVVNSHYRPSRNVLLVSKKTPPEPTPTPMPTPTLTITPTVSISNTATITPTVKPATTPIPTLGQTP